MKYSNLPFYIVLLLLLAFQSAYSQTNNKTTDNKKNPDTDFKEKLKEYFLCKKVSNYFPTDLNVFFGNTRSKLKYPSFDDFRDLYLTKYAKDIPAFAPVSAFGYGVNFRFAGIGIEIGKLNSQFHTIAPDNESFGSPKVTGRREFFLDLDEGNMSILMAMRKKKFGYGLNIGGVHGKIKFQPVFRSETGSIIDGPQLYLNGTFYGSYTFATLGPTVYFGFGRFKAELRYDWALKQYASDNFPTGVAIREENIFDPSPYGPYIPRNLEAYNDIKSKSGAGDGRMYMGSNLRSNKLTIRLAYSIIFRSLNLNKPKK